MGGMMAKPPGMPAEVPSHWSVYFVVSDVDATVAKATELGGNAFLPAFDSPQGRLAGIVDPFGARFMVINPTGVPQE